jgi:adenine-specific DNA-methyltransferase
VTSGPPPESCKVYTPLELAAAMIRALGDDPEGIWLEPSHGQGAFVRAIAALSVPKSRIVAVDLDPTPAAADRLATTLRGTDFLSWASKTNRRFARIVGNPPYVSLSRLNGESRRIAASVSGPSGVPIGLGANTWYAFVLMALRVLERGGSLAFVLPSAAEYADYSADIRSTIGQRFESVHLFRCRRPLFPDVQEGTMVAIARGYGRGPCKPQRKTFDTAERLIEAMTGQGIGSPGSCLSGSKLNKDAQRLGDLAQIRLGGVTGDAKFFLMTEARRKAERLPLRAVTPVLTRARHLRSGVLTAAHWEELRRNEERVWLFNPSDAALRTESVARRLQLLEEDGGCRRDAFKIASRSPWYRTPLPAAPHGFLSGMGMAGPWIAFNAVPRLNATNTLYVITFQPFVEPADRFKIALALLTSEARHRLRQVARRYADGLLKYEPGALSDIGLPQMRQEADWQAIYENAVSLLLAGKHRRSRETADAYVV